MDDVTLTAYASEIRTLNEQGRYEQALALGRHVLHYFPKDITTYEQLAEAALERGDLEGALDLFRRVLSADPENVSAYIGTAMILEQQKLTEEAVWHLERAFELAPEDPDVRQELQRLYSEVGPAVSRVKLTPGALARLYSQQGLYTRAIHEYQFLLNDSPYRYDLTTGLIEATWRAGRMREAADLAQKLVEKLPYSLKANLILGTALQESGVAEGANYLENAQALDPTNRVAREMLGTRSPLEATNPTLPQYVEGVEAPPREAPAAPETPATGWFTDEGEAESEQSAEIDISQLGSAHEKTPLDLAREFFGVDESALAAAPQEPAAAAEPEASPQELAPATASETEPQEIAPDTVAEVSPQELAPVTEAMAAPQEPAPAATIEAEAQPVEFQIVESLAVEPQAVELQAVEQQAVEPSVAEPEAAQPQAAQPQAVEPSVAEPPVVEPLAAVQAEDTSALPSSLLTEPTIEPVVEPTAEPVVEPLAERAAVKAEAPAAAEPEPAPTPAGSNLPPWLFATSEPEAPRESETPSEAAVLAATPSSAQPDWLSEMTQSLDVAQPKASEPEAPGESPATLQATPPAEPPLPTVQPQPESEFAATTAPERTPEIPEQAPAEIVAPSWATSSAMLREAGEAAEIQAPTWLSERPAPEPTASVAAQGQVEENAPEIESAEVVSAPQAEPTSAATPVATTLPGKPTTRPEELLGAPIPESGEPLHPVIIQSDAEAAQTLARAAEALSGPGLAWAGALAEGQTQPAQALEPAPMPSEQPGPSAAAARRQRTLKAAERLEQARFLRDDNRMDEALVEYEYIIQHAPRLVQQVIPDLEEISARPNAPVQAHRILGDAYTRVDRLSDALDCYRFVLERPQSKA